MESVLQQAFLILEQRSVVSVETAKKIYEQCCSSLNLAPTPLELPESEVENPP